MRHDGLCKFCETKVADIELPNELNQAQIEANTIIYVCDSEACKAANAQEQEAARLADEEAQRDELRRILGI